MSKAKIFTVRSREADPQSLDGVRLIRAGRRSQVESFLIGEFEIAAATVDEALELGKAGVVVEEAGAGT